MIQFSQIGFIFSEKRPIMKFSRNSKSFKGICFFLRSLKVENFPTNKSVFFFCLFSFIDSFPTVCWLCFYYSDQFLNYLVPRGIDFLIAWAQPGVHATILICHEIVSTARFIIYMRGELSRTTKSFQIQLRQLIGFTNSIHD